MATGAKKLAVTQREADDNPPMGDAFPEYQQPYVADNMSVITQRGKYDPAIGTETTHAQDAVTGQSYGSIARRTVDNKVVALPTGGKGTSVQPGTTDPLTGNPVGYVEPYSPDNHSVDLHLRNLVQVMSGMLVILKAQTPILPAQLDFDGDGTVDGIVSRKITFQLGSKNVPALQLLIQNNSAVAITLGISEPASPNSYRIPAGGTFQGTVVANFISLLSTTLAAIPINGTNGVVVKVWTNPEWTNVRGNV